MRRSPSGRAPHNAAASATLAVPIEFRTTELGFGTPTAPSSSVVNVISSAVSPCQKPQSSTASTMPGSSAFTSAVAKALMARRSSPPCASSSASAAPTLVADAPRVEPTPTTSVRGTIRSTLSLGVAARSSTTMIHVASSPPPTTLAGRAGNGKPSGLRSTTFSPASMAAEHAPMSPSAVASSCSTSSSSTESIDGPPVTTAVRLSESAMCRANGPASPASATTKFASTHTTAGSVSLSRNRGAMSRTAAPASRNSTTAPSLGHNRCTAALTGPSGTTASAPSRPARSAASPR